MSSRRLQRACRSFLLRLVAEQGPDEASRILRRLADELDELARELGVLGRHTSQRYKRNWTG